MIVGVIGKKRAGKDTFATTLVDELGFVRVAFADRLKEVALAIDPIVPPRTGSVTVSAETASTWGLPRLSEVVAREGWEEAKENPEVRRLLQETGVAIRSIRSDFWIRAALDPTEYSANDFVVTDVRFPNEAEAIERAGGFTVRVTRPGMTHDDEHVSETALDDYAADFLALNDGTLDELAEQAREIVRIATRVLDE